MPISLYLDLADLSSNLCITLIAESTERPSGNSLVRTGKFYFERARRAKSFLLSPETTPNGVLILTGHKT